MGWLVNTYREDDGYIVSVLTLDETEERARAKLLRMRKREPIDSEWFDDRDEADKYLERIFKAGVHAGK